MKYFKSIIDSGWLQMLFLSFVMYEVLWSLVEIQYSSLDFNIKDLLFDFILCALFTSTTFILKYGFTKIRGGKYAMTKVEIIALFLICSFLIFIIDRVFFSQYNANNSLGNVIDVYIICIICSFFSVLNMQHTYHNQYVKMKQEQEKLKLSVLQRQLSPHFMFNSLSTLQGVMLTDSLKAESYLNALSSLLRFFTDNIGKDKIALKEAMLFIEDYILILNTRFPQHFLFNIEVCNIPNNAYILPVSIQAAIENAVKHNKHSCKNPLEIKITNDDSFIIVTNHKQPIENNTESLGIGLSNLIERYKLQTNSEPCVCETKEYYSIKIPLIYESTNC